MITIILLLTELNVQAGLDLGLKLPRLGAPRLKGEPAELFIFF